MAGRAAYAEHNPHTWHSTHLYQAFKTHANMVLAAEELKWRAELREKEAARMSVLEGEWRRRERVRETEVAAMKAEYAALEERTRQVRLRLSCFAGMCRMDGGVAGLRSL